MSNPRAARIIAEFDATLTGLEDTTARRLFAILEQSYIGLERQILGRYGDALNDKSDIPKKRALRLIEEVGQAIQLLRPEGAEAVQEAFEDLLKQSSGLGTTLADELAFAVADERLKSFAHVPLDAVRFAAENAVKRLSKHGEKFAENATIVIGQGLTQGWSAANLSTVLRTTLGITKTAANRIARTESISALDEATRARYRANDIELVQRIATQDNRVCAWCADRAGNVYKLDEAPAVIHPNDRCYNAPFKRKWLAAGVMDVEWIVQHREAVQAAALKSPNSGPAVFEQKAPKPVLTVAQLRLPPPSPATPKPQPKSQKAKPTGFPKTLDRLETERKLGGSTGATLVKDPTTGRRFVMKRGNSPDHVREEAAADAAYRALGVSVPKFKLYETDDGPVKLAEFIEGKSLSSALNSATPAEAKRLKKQIQKHFAADALLGNWDVAGQGMDNILIDAKGKVWRIDNGGSLRFRAQGKSKDDAWNQYPEELWSLRDSNRNKQTASLFEGMKHSEVVKQIGAISGKESKLLKALPKELHETVQGRLSEMHRIAEISKTLANDKWNDGYISDFTKHSLGLRAAGIVDKMPQRLDPTGGGEEGTQVVDENGKPFDNLRGRGSTMGDLSKYLKSIGGKYGTIRNWMMDQAGDSWSGESQAVKLFFAEQRDISLQKYFWRDGLDKAKSHLAEQRANAGGKEKHRQVWSAWHAFNYEMLDAISFQKKNNKNKTIQLIRTENAEVLTKNGIREGDRGIRMRRGGAESASIYNRVKAFGSELTVQEVPLHRIIGNYFYERSPGLDRSPFMSDKENEFVFFPEGIEFDYDNSHDPTPEYTGILKQVAEQPAKNKVEVAKGSGLDDLLGLLEDEGEGSSLADLFE